MREKIAKLRMIMLILLLGTGIFSFGRDSDVATAKTVISGYDELKRELESHGKKTVRIAGTIRISSPIYVKGKKTVVGQGELIRDTSKGNAYRGSLFVVNGSSLTVRCLIISGGGRKKRLKDGVTGRLLEVKNGEFILGKKTVLKNNINGRLAMSGGGAVLVQEGGRFFMKGGEISSNKSVMGGAGVRVEKRGLFCMTGGKIVGNQSVGIGAVEGFDGRGGAIYNEGEVTIAGGMISGNSAKKYSARQHEYGGVGGMLYSRGKCVITGGNITNNRASSCGGAMYLDSQSYFRILGGTIRGNRAEQGNDICAAEGRGYLSGNPVLGSLYVKTGFTLEAGKKLLVRKRILLLPEKYKKGWCIVKDGEAKDFFIGRSRDWRLRQRADGIYLEKNQIKKDIKRKSVQKIVKSPVLKLIGNPLQFYESEFVNKDVLCFGITASDKIDGDLNKEIEVSKIVYPNGRVEKNPNELDTNITGVGSIYYKVKNSRGHHGKLKAAYQVIKNKKMKIEVAPRYLFVWEVQRYSPEKWKEVLLANCRLEDDCGTKDEWQRDMKIKWNGLTENRAGKYLVNIRIRDQWGHRYYMKQGKAGRYGLGKVCHVQIPVTLVAGNREGNDTSGGYVRFFPESGSFSGEGEIWHFKGTDIMRVKQYMAQQKNPFSVECNETFLKRFRYCCQGREETPDGKK